MKGSTLSKENWEERKEKLKKKFAILNESDVLFEEGKLNEMMGGLQIKLDKSRDEIQKIIDSL